jgi:hypothetical protein
LRQLRLAFSTRNVPRAELDRIGARFCDGCDNPWQHLRLLQYPVTTPGVQFTIDATGPDLIDG